MDPAAIRRLEELGLNALPPLHTLLYDGWVLRFAEGYTGRANSVSPLYRSSLDIADKVPWCEQRYRERGLRPAFRLTAVADPQLDGFLAQRGYVRPGAEVSILTRDLEGWSSGDVEDVEVRVGTVPEEWLSGLAGLHPRVEQHLPTVRRVLERLAPETAYALVRAHGRVVATGRAVLEDRNVGLFDLFTDAARRRQGLATRVTGRLLAWARGRGAIRSYLQVAVDNAPACRLYSKLGFGEAYLYWYRVASD